MIEITSVFAGINTKLTYEPVATDVDYMATFNHVSYGATTQLVLCSAQPDLPARAAAFLLELLNKHYAEHPEDVMVSKIGVRAAFN